MAENALAQAKTTKKDAAPAAKKEAASTVAKMKGMSAKKDKGAEKSQETIELMELDRGSIHVAQYMTKMPPKEILEQKLSLAIANAKAQLEQREK